MQKWCPEKLDMTACVFIVVGILVLGLFRVAVVYHEVVTPLAMVGAVIVVGSVITYNVAKAKVPEEAAVQNRDLRVYWRDTAYEDRLEMTEREDRFILGGFCI